jgi:hypothetical protein
MAAYPSSMVRVGALQPVVLSACMHSCKVPMILDPLNQKTGTSIVLVQVQQRQSHHHQSTMAKPQNLKVTPRKRVTIMEWKSKETSRGVKGKYVKVSPKRRGPSVMSSPTKSTASHSDAILHHADTEFNLDLDQGPLQPLQLPKSLVCFLETTLYKLIICI